MDNSKPDNPVLNLTKTTGLKKKSPKKRVSPKLSVKQDLLLEKLKLFYDKNDNMNSILEIVNNNSKISLRIIDWFVTNYSKKKFIIIPIKKYESSLDIAVSKTKKATKFKEIDLNVFLNYKAQLKAYSKKNFDPFCRRERITFKYNKNDSIITTVGQLNFFKWAIENGIINYIKNNLEDIEDDMNTNIKKSKSKSKSKKKKFIKDTGPCHIKYDNTDPNIKLDDKHTHRKKRRELSSSAVKKLNRHSGNIILNFD